MMTMTVMTTSSLYMHLHHQFRESSLVWEVGGEMIVLEPTASTCTFFSYLRNDWLREIHTYR